MEQNQACKLQLDQSHWDNTSPGWNYEEKNLSSLTSKWHYVVPIKIITNHSNCDHSLQSFMSLSEKNIWSMSMFANHHLETWAVDWSYYYLYAITQWKTKMTRITEKAIANNQKQSPRVNPEGKARGQNPRARRKQQLICWKACVL